MESFDGEGCPTTLHLSRSCNSKRAKTRTRAPGDLPTLLLVAMKLLHAEPDTNLTACYERLFPFLARGLPQNVTEGCSKSAASISH